MFSNMTPIDAFIIGCFISLVVFAFWLKRQITPKDYPPDFSKFTSKVMCTQNGLVLKEDIPFTIAYLLIISPDKNKEIIIGDLVYKLK